MKSLSWKIFYGFLMIITLFTGLILILSFNTISGFYFELSQNSIISQHTLISNIINDNNFKDLDEIESYVRKVSKTKKSSIVLCDKSGNLIVGSDTQSGFENKRINSNILSSIIDKSDKNQGYVNTFVDNDNLIISTPIFVDGKFNGILSTYSKTNEINKFTNLLIIDLIIIIVIVIVFSLIVAWLISLKIIKPIKDLSRASRKVALGDFDNKVFFPGDDEVANLASNFNQMTMKLKDYFLLSESRHEHYMTLIGSIQAGLAVIDRFGKIVMHNNSFEQINKTSIGEGRYYWELITSQVFKEFIQKINNEKKNISTEIELQDLNFLCSANYIETKNEVVVLFNDITDIKKFENIKRDFVVNVTHELRTPLTAIKGFIETIEDDPEGENLPYINIISRHTERLINIVEDLLTLSEIEQPNSHIELSQSEIKPIFENIKRNFGHRINDKNLELKVEIAENIPPFMMDPFRIEQVLINLIDNAVKYTEKGYVKITANVDEKCGIITVEDTGIGIPKEHHSRLFERFYTVDKSRSRKVGGTGLGLSIVKHIILLHNGSISINSSSGDGTKFTIKLPLNNS